MLSLQPHAFNDESVRDEPPSQPYALNKERVRDGKGVAATRTAQRPLSVLWRKLRSSWSVASAMEGMRTPELGEVGASETFHL